MTFWKWSKTAASNSNADSTINWAEGQAPSSVNDSARALMAGAAKYRDDIAGALVTTGTSTAYALTSNQVFDTLAHMDGAMIAFSPHTTSGATVTLAVDGLTAKPLRSAPSVELPSGTLIQGTPYVATYNNSDGAFYLRDFYGNPYSVPIGGMMDFIGTTAPNSSFVLPYGQAISRTTYATLFGITSTTFGTGDGSTTFNVPDLRGRLVAGVDNMGGSTASRITNAGSGLVGTTLGAAGGAQNQTVAQANLPNVNFTVTDSGHTHAAPGTALYNSGQAGTPGGATYLFGLLDSSQRTGSSVTGISVNSGGSGTALTTLPPTIILNKLLRVI